MVLCHVQLVVGLGLYAMRWQSFAVRPADEARFWKYEHISTMILAIALVTIGRVASKRAKTERGKQLRVAVFYLIALVLMLWATPWPFTERGAARGWL
jgi:cell division protein FtsW (lipid II flippase)